MDESLKCECGNEEFWFFWNYVRCPKCSNEYKKTLTYKGEVEYWVRRWNKEEMKFNNWEHTK